MTEVQKHLWADLSSAPLAPGVYAWYYNPLISDFDLTQVVAGVRSLRDTDRGAAERMVRETLDERLFSFMREEPYSARIGGALKPAYEGELHHAFRMSPDLIGRIVDDPERLQDIRRVLALSAPHFASPLYMGMSNNLRGRLAQHRRLIEKYRASLKDEPSALRDTDAGFAWQVAKRRIPLDRLTVFTCTVGNDDASIATDVENILNRLFYPVLGRN